MTSPLASAADRAAALDAADPLAPYRAAFVPADGVAAYLDGNSLGRPLLATRERLSGFVDGPWGERLIRSWDEGWMDAPIVVGDRIGEVALGAASGQTVVADSTSVLLYKLIHAAAAARPGRTELVLDRDNFPTDRFIAAGIAESLGLSIAWIEIDRAGGVEVEAVRAAVSERTAVVVLSHVAYRSGHLADLRAITAAAHEVGALVLWDLCHSVGSVPLELDADDADFAVGCTYKYLNGGPGAPAFGYVAERLLGELQQPIHGWMGAAAPFAMDLTDYRPATGIRRLLSGTPPILGMLPLQDMLDLIATAGMPAIRKKSQALTSYAVELCEELLTPYGVALASPRDPARRGGHITIDHPAFQDVTAALWQEGVIPDFRPPHGIRLGLSPLSTSYAEVALGVTAIARLLDEVSRLVPRSVEVGTPKCRGW